MPDPRRGFMLTLVLVFLTSIRTFAEPSCAALMGAPVVGDLYRQIKMKDEAVRFALADPQGAKLLASLNRLFGQIDADLLGHLRFFTRLPISAESLRELLGKYRDWGPEDYELLVLLLRGARQAPAEITLGPQMERSDPMDEQRFHRLRWMTTQDRYRQGLQEVLMSERANYLLRHYPKSFPTILENDQINHRKLQRFYGLLHPSSTRLVRAGVKETAALAFYFNMLNGLFSFYTDQLTPEHKLLCWLIKPDGWHVRREMLLGLLATVYHATNPVLDVFDHYLFGTEPLMSDRALTDLMLENARKIVLPWKTRFVEHVRQAEHEVPIPTREVTACEYKAVDLFRPRGGLRPLREKSPPSSTTCAAPPPAAAPPPGELLGEPRSRDVSQLRSNKYYVFKFHEQKPQVWHRVQFGPLALAWFNAHPKIAAQFLHALTLGNLKPWKKTGLRDWKCMGPGYYELKTPKPYRGKMRLLNGVYQLYEIVDNETFYKTTSCPGPLEVPPEYQSANFAAPP